MPRFAVGFFSLHNNELKIEICEGDDWRHATLQHSLSWWGTRIEREANPVKEDFDTEEDYLQAVDTAPNLIPEDIEDAREEAFNADGAFDCVAIP